MLIQKGEKEYTVRQTKTGWTVTRSVGGVTIHYKIPNEVAADAQTLRRYILENDDLF